MSRSPLISPITQSASHLMMVEPVAFHANPQTMTTNTYQHPDPIDIAAVQRAARAEFLAFRDRLVGVGIPVTSFLGEADSPDDVFPNWASTHIRPDGSRGLIYYPMLNENRRIERRPFMMEHLEKTYDVMLDMSGHEQQGIALEGTSALWMDRVHKIAFSAVSARSNQDLARQWCSFMGYEYVPFHTRDHMGKPIYHSDVMMFIGTGYVGVCLECIADDERDSVRRKIESTGREIIAIRSEQLLEFCGNALEVRANDGSLKLVMSSSAYRAYSDEQKAAFLHYVDEIIHSDLPTIQTYGGGAARCMLMELF